MHHWSRERELAADAFGSRIAGTESSALALLRISGLHRIVDAALAHNRQAPAEERGGVLKMVRRLVAEHGLDDPQERLQDQQAHPLDSHRRSSSAWTRWAWPSRPSCWPARARATPRCWSSWGWNRPCPLERRQPRRAGFADPIRRRHE